MILVGNMESQWSKEIQAVGSNAIFMDNNIME
jgi:hypothetical protein